MKCISGRAESKRERIWMTSVWWVWSSRKNMIKKCRIAWTVGVVRGVVNNDTQEPFYYGLLIICTLKNISTVRVSYLESEEVGHKIEAVTYLEYPL